MMVHFYLAWFLPFSLIETFGHKFLMCPSGLSQGGTEKAQYAIFVLPVIFHLSEENDLAAVFA